MSPASKTPTAVRTPLAMVVSAVFARKGELTDDLPPDMRARLVRISELIESVGLPNVKEPHLRHIRGPLSEIRLKRKAGIARALDVTARE